MTRTFSLSTAFILDIGYFFATAGARVNSRTLRTALEKEP